MFVMFIKFCEMFRNAYMTFLLLAVLPSLNKSQPNRMLVHILQKFSEVRNDESLLPLLCPDTNVRTFDLV